MTTIRPLRCEDGTRHSRDTWTQRPSRDDTWTRRDDTWTRRDDTWTRA